MPTPDDTPTVCPHCHDAVSEGARLCPNCGTSLALPDTDVPVYETQSRTGDIALGVFAGLIFPPLLAALIYAAFYFSAAPPVRSLDIMAFLFFTLFLWVIIIGVLIKLFNTSRVLLVIVLRKMLIGWFWLGVLLFLGFLASCLVGVMPR